MKNFFTLVFLLLLLNKITTAQNEPACPWQNIASVKMAGMTITLIECVPAGDYSPRNGVALKGLPAFCRVAATLKPTPGSNIKIEVWMPQTKWNERFLGTGTGGGAGNINYGSLAAGLKRGFATVNTDMGTSPNADSAIGHPEKWADFGYRATHEMTLAGKAIMLAYYKKAAHHSYFAGCSTGGQQALMEAQRYPDDYNGILAGAPANNRTHLHTGFLWNFKAANQVSGTVILPAKKIALLTSFIKMSCRGKDGGAPGDDFLTDPRSCAFDLQTLPVCLNGLETDTCFTREQVEVLKKIYAGPVNPKTGERIYTPIPFGSENSANGISYQLNPKEGPVSLYYQFKWLFGKNFDYSTFDFDTDIQKMDSLLAPLLNANNPDLSALKKQNGKILMYTGTADPIVPFQDAINYYERVIDLQHGLKPTQDFFRFFLVPGMAHCGGGLGLTDFGQNLSLEIKQDNEHDAMTALIKWVEAGTAPDKIIATAFNCCDTVNRVRSQRPIYPYPKFPRYKSGDVNSPLSYEGVDRERGNVLKPAERYLK